jgi:excinuclease ABC subunit C
MTTDDDRSYVNYLRVINGGIVQAHTVEVKTRLDESREDILLATFIDLRQRFESNAPEILVPFLPGTDLEGIRFNVPQKGDKKKLLELSERNVQYYKAEKLKQLELVDPERHVNRLLEKMMQDLRLRELPRHIECFDNSNIQGSDPVSAMVVFRDARPSKKDYRHFNVKTVEGPDDFATMEEVITRRYRRLLEENQSLPQLIVVDGGKGQLNAALKALEGLGLRGRTAIIGIAKRLEELYYPGDPLPLHLDKKSETLRIIQQLRDEAHRFGITHHRKRREKSTIKSELTDIEGIGYKTAQALLWRFKSVRKIKEASLQDLQAAIGKIKGLVVYEHFRQPSGKEAALPLNPGV